MYVIKFLLTLTLLKNISSLNDTKTQMLTDLFTQKNIKFLYFVGCFSRRQTVEINRALQDENIRTAFISLEKLDHIFTHGYIFVLNCDNDSLDILRNYTSKINPKTVFIKEEGTSYEFWTSFGTCVGFWNITNFTLNEERVDLSNVLITSSSTENIYYFEYKTKRERAESISLYHYNLFVLLQEIHNFSYKMTFLPKESNFGNSLIALKYIQSKSSDIFITGELQTAEKIDTVDFLMPFYKFKSSCFFFQLPKKSTVSYIKPFSANTWYAVIVTSVIFTIGLKIALVVSDAEDTSWTISFMTVFGTLCQDGDDPSPDSRDKGCKLVYLNILILSLLLFNYYTSMMVSLLFSTEIRVDSSVNYLLYSEMEVGIEDEYYVKNWLEETNFSNIRLLYKKKIHGNTYPPSVGLSKITSSNFAYYTDTSTAYTTIRGLKQEEICNMAQIHMIPPSFVGFALPKNSELFELFQTSLFKLRERGLVERLQMLWKVEKAQCYGTTEVLPVGMEQGMQALACLGVGVFLSPIILTCEIYFRRRR